MLFKVWLAFQEEALSFEGFREQGKDFRDRLKVFLFPFFRWSIAILLPQDPSTHAV